MTGNRASFKDARLSGLTPNQNSYSSQEKESAPKKKKWSGMEAELKSSFKSSTGISRGGKAEMAEAEYMPPGGLHHWDKKRRVIGLSW